MMLHVCKHSNKLCSVIFVNFYNFLNKDVIMSSLVSTGNCKLGHDCRRVHVFTPTTRRNCRQLVANSCSQSRRRRDNTVSSRRRRRCVLGIRHIPAVSDGQTDGGARRCRKDRAIHSVARVKMSVLLQTVGVYVHTKILVHYA